MFFIQSETDVGAKIFSVFGTDHKYDSTHKVILHLFDTTPLLRALNSLSKVIDSRATLLPRQMRRQQLSNLIMNVLT